MIPNNSGEGGPPKELIDMVKGFMSKILGMSPELLQVISTPPPDNFQGQLHRMEQAFYRDIAWSLGVTVEQLMDEYGDEVRERYRRCLKKHVSRFN